MSEFWITSTPFDFLFIVVPAVLVVYLLLGVCKQMKEYATREEEQEAALEDAINCWLEDPSPENRMRVDKAVEARYG